jgi:hypothetical protein
MKNYYTLFICTIFIQYILFADVSDALALVPVAIKATEGKLNPRRVSGFCDAEGVILCFYS